jgi:RNA polymerase sigma factor (sigma-70 family)
MQASGSPSSENQLREKFWRQLIAGYDGRLHAYCRFLRCEPEDANEVLWDIWQEAIELEPTLAASVDQWPILKRLARSACSARRRQRGRERSIEDDLAIEVTDTVEERDGERVLRAWTESVLAVLPEKQRLAVDFRFRWGWPYWAVAAAIETSERTARVHVARGLHRLRRLAHEVAPPAR